MLVQLNNLSGNNNDMLTIINVIAPKLCFFRFSSLVEVRTSIKANQFDMLEEKDTNGAAWTIARKHLVLLEEAVALGRSIDPKSFQEAFGQFGHLFNTQAYSIVPRDTMLSIFVTNDSGTRTAKPHLPA